MTPSGTWDGIGSFRLPSLRAILSACPARTPIFALTAYAKNQRVDLSQADRNDFRRVTALLIERYARRTRQ
jgi:hypothetical protein